MKCFPFKTVQVITREEIDNYIIPMVLKQVREQVIPDVLDRLNETNELLNSFPIAPPKPIHMSKKSPEIVDE